MKNLFQSTGNTDHNHLDVPTDSLTKNPTKSPTNAPANVPTAMPNDKLIDTPTVVPIWPTDE